MSKIQNSEILNNMEWQVLRESLELWRSNNKSSTEVKKTASYSLEEKIDKVFTQNMKEQKI